MGSEEARIRQIIRDYCKFLRAAIHPAVLWKKNSFGSESEQGSVFVARVLTVMTSLRSQDRDILDFLTETIKN